MAKQKLERFIVTGPGLDPEPSYADPGPALSRALTAALAATDDLTFYARDSVSGEVIGFAERSEKSVTCVRR
jgi:hypothetical protein